MPDEQLIHLAHTEGQYLTGMAIGILHEEFLNRKLGTPVFEALDENEIAQRKRNIEIWNKPKK